jgi:RNA methyltransferase, TrmH family
MLIYTLALGDVKTPVMKQGKKSQEMKVYGRRAGEKLFEMRPQDIIRAYVTQDGLFNFKKIIKYCADQKLAYHIVEATELESIAKSNHHEGLCLLVKKRELPPLKDLFTTKGRSLLVALEEVENPHNLGAIMRSCAHFGVTGIIYQAKVPVAQTAAAFRTAEGGAEICPAIRVENWNEVMELAREQKFQSFSTSSHGGKSLFEIKFPEKSLIFMGAEGAGLSDKLFKMLGNNKIQIPGTDQVESLNVSNATTVIVAEWYRQGI